MESSGHAGQTIAILLVEDEEITLNLLANILSKKYPHATLFPAGNGRRGLELFSANFPAIVITDIKMPGMSGLELISEVRALKPETQFIALTADTGRRSLGDAVDEGFELNHYIVKPVDFKSLFAAIDQCIGRIAKL